MSRRIVATFATVAVLGALSCGGGEDSPVLSPVATPSPTTEATPASTRAPATSPQTATATPVATATATPATPAPGPTLADPAPTVAGPLIVFSDEFGSARRVYAYDVDSERYWAVLDYEYVSGQRTVQVAGAGLVVWDGGRVPRVRRVSLDGFTEAPLFEHEAAIDDVRASPDGAKVAVLYAATLLVVDSAGGQELRSVSLALPLGDLPPPNERSYAIGKWSTDGAALTVSIRGSRPEDRRTLMVPLDGAPRVLPGDWYLSPDFRYALRPGELLLGVRYSYGDDFHTDRLWKEFDVVEVEGGAVLWTVRSAQGDGIIPGGGEWDHESGRFAYFEYVVPLLEGKYADARLSAGQARASWRSRGDADGVSPRVFDLAAGVSRTLSREEWVELQGRRVERICGGSSGYQPECILWFEGRMVWEGDVGLVKLVELDRPMMVRGELFTAPRLQCSRP